MMTRKFIEKKVEILYNLLHSYDANNNMRQVIDNSLKDPNNNLHLLLTKKMANS